MLGSNLFWFCRHNLTLQKLVSFCTAKEFLGFYKTFYTMRRRPKERFLLFFSSSESIGAALSSKSRIFDRVEDGLLDVLVHASWIEKLN